MSLVNEFNDKVKELEKLTSELDADFLRVKFSDESLIIEGVMDSLKEAKHQIKKVILMEEARTKKSA